MGEFVNDVQKYESKEESEHILNETSRRFAFDNRDLDDLKIQSENVPINVDIKGITSVILRHWKPITITFSKLQHLEKIWMVLELLQCREKLSIYQVNKQIVSYTSYPGKSCNITDPQHKFLFRQFHRFLLKASS